MALMGMVMYVFAPEMIGVLSPVESIRELGTTCLRIEAFAEPFFAASIVTYSVCVGAGDTMKPAAINLSTMWLVRLTLAYGLSKSYDWRVFGWQWLRSLPSVASSSLSASSEGHG